MVKTNMVFTKNGVIEYKVFTIRELDKIIKFFKKRKEELSDKNVTLVIKAEFEDDSSHKGNDISVLDESKLMESITFHLINLNSDKNLYMNISNNGRYSVEGNDKDWVNANKSEIEEILAATPNQNYWLSNFKSQLIISNSIGVVFGILVYFSVFNRLIGQPGVAGFIVIMGTVFSGQGITSIVLNRWLFSSYPMVEFDTTLDHLNKRKKRKNFLKSLGALLIIPITIEILIRLFLD